MKYRVRRRRSVTQIIEIEAPDATIAEIRARDFEGKQIGYPRSEIQIEILRAIDDSEHELKE